MPSATSAPRRTATSPATSGPTAGDDPVEATALLLAVRARCLTGGERSCFEQTDQADSAIAADDLVRLNAARPADDAGPGDAGSGDASAADRFNRAAFTLALVERTGDSALVEITPRPGSDEAAQTKPASVLVIKGEAGWRLRAVFGA
jgi:hypothetical protein